MLKNSRYMTNYLISRWQPAAMWALCENHKYSNLGAFAAPFSTCLSVFKHHPSSGYNSAPRLMTLSSPRPFQGHRRPKVKVAFAGGWLPIHPAIGPILIMCLSVTVSTQCPRVTTDDGDRRQTLRRNMRRYTKCTVA